MQGAFTLAFAVCFLFAGCSQAGFTLSRVEVSAFLVRPGEPVVLRREFSALRLYI